MGIIHRAGILRGALISSQSSLSASHGRGPQPMSVRTAKPRAASSMGKAHVHPRPGPLGESRHKGGAHEANNDGDGDEGQHAAP